MPGTEAILPIAGKVSRLLVEVPDGAEGTKFVPVNGRVDMTLNLNKGEIDASHMDSEGWSNYLQGRRDATIDFSLRYLPGDEGQEALIDHYFESEQGEGELNIRFVIQRVEDAPVYEASAFITSLTISAPDEAAQDMNGTLRVNDAVSVDEYEGEEEEED